MRITVLGTGPTGANIGAALVGTDGIEMKYGSRDPKNPRVVSLVEVQKSQPNSSTMLTGGEGEYISVHNSRKCIWNVVMAFEGKITVILVHVSSGF